MNTRRLLASLLLSLCTPFAASAHSEHLAEGVAPILNGDTHSAREAALRNALADISRSAGVDVRAQTRTHNFTLEQDQTQLRSHVRVLNHEVMQESRNGDVYRVLVRAEVAETSADSERTVSCDSAHIKRVLIGGFPLTQPQQLKSNELKGYAHLTAREIVRHLKGKPALLADHSSDLMIRYAAPEHSQADIVLDEQSWVRVRAAAEAHRAQFVLLGQFRNFALNARESQRDLQLDVLLLDAYSGSTVARVRLDETARGDVVADPSLGFATPAFYATDLGESYQRLVQRAADWMQTSLRCHAFGTRVIKTEGTRIYIDAGAEQGLQIGDAFDALQTRPGHLISAAGENLGYERIRLGQARLIAVYPRFSIAEMPGHNTLPHPGDELYSY